MSVDMDRKLAPRWWRRRRVTAAAAVLGMALLVGLVSIAFASSGKRTLREPIATISIETVKRGVYHDVITLAGTIVPHDNVDVAALAGGQVESVMARSGDMVAAGQPLIKFHNADLELQVLGQQAQLTQSITGLQNQLQGLEATRLANETAAATTEYNIADMTSVVARQEQLAAKGAVAQQTLDQSREQLALYLRLKPLQTESHQRQEGLRQSLTPQIEDALASQVHSLKLAGEQLDNLVVKAPAAGQLADFNPNVGQNINRGEQLGTVAPATGFKVQARIDQYYLSRVHPGQDASARIGDRDWTLVVSRVYPQVKDGSFTADFDFDGPPPGGLLAGQAVVGRLSLGGDQPALVLPTGPFLERSGGDWAMVMTSPRRAVRRSIQIGRRNGDQVEILGGLSPGERVVTSDYGAYDKIDQLDLTN